MRKMWTKKLFLFVLVSISLYLATGQEQCEEEDIMMINGTVTVDNGVYFMKGGLQVCVNRGWATVCQHNWDDKDSIVACQQLGLNYSGSKLLRIPISNFSSRMFDKANQIEK